MNSLETYTIIYASTCPHLSFWTVWNCVLWKRDYCNIYKLKGSNAWCRSSSYLCFSIVESTDHTYGVSKAVLLTSANLEGTWVPHDLWKFEPSCLGVWGSKLVIVLYPVQFLDFIPSKRQKLWGKTFCRRYTVDVWGSITAYLFCDGSVVGRSSCVFSSLPCLRTFHGPVHPYSERSFTGVLFPSLCVGWFVRMWQTMVWTRCFQWLL